jgi:hypothetical protein
MPTNIRLARVVLASTVAAVSCGAVFVLAGQNVGSRTPATTSIEADAANGLPTGKRTYHPQLIALSDEPVPAGATTAQFAGGRQPTPPQPV